MADAEFAPTFRAIGMNADFYRLLLSWGLDLRGRPPLYETLSRTLHDIGWNWTGDKGWTW